MISNNILRPKLKLETIPFTLAYTTYTKLILQKNLFIVFCTISIVGFAVYLNMKKHIENILSENNF